MTDRRATVAAAFDKAMRPAPTPAASRPDLSYMETLGETVLNEHRAGRIRPGGMSNIINNFVPREELPGVMQAVLDADNEREKGRHGNVDAVADHYGVARPVLDAVMDNVDVDYVAMRLQQRHSDADLPIPELTRRDYLSAAYDAHASQGE